MPLRVHRRTRRLGVLRLQDCFALRSSPFAQDDQADNTLPTSALHHCQRMWKGWGTQWS